MSLKIPNNVLFNTNVYPSLLQSLLQTPIAKSCSFRHLAKLSAISPHLWPNKYLQKFNFDKDDVPHSSLQTT